VSETAAGEAQSSIPDPASNGGAAGAPEAPMRLGGMALRNGLLVHGPTSWAAAARNSASGAVDVASGPRPDFGGRRVAKVPLLRGPIRMAEAMAVIPIARRALPSARLPFEDPRVLAAGAGVVLLNTALLGRAGQRANAGREALSATLGLLPALVALTGSELAAYHGVEHKAIAAYEQGSRDPSIAPKEHQRCGSNLIAPMIVFTVAGQAIIDRLPGHSGRIGQMTTSIASLSLAVEVFTFAERHPDSPLGRAVHRSGDTIQRLLATREPSAEQIEVGVAAMDAILEAESPSA
jgi:uncharacterized protein YqhQ